MCREQCFAAAYSSRTDILTKFLRCMRREHCSAAVYSSQTDFLLSSCGVCTAYSPVLPRMVREASFCYVLFANCSRGIHHIPRTSRVHLLCTTMYAVCMQLVHQVFAAETLVHKAKSVLGINCCIFLQCRDHSQSWKLQLTLGEHTEAQFEVWELQSSCFEGSPFNCTKLCSIGSMGFFWIMFKTVEKGFLPASIHTIIQKMTSFLQYLHVSDSFIPGKEWKGCLKFGHFFKIWVISPWKEKNYPKIMLPPTLDDHSIRHWPIYMQYMIKYHFFAFQSS